MNSSGNRRVRVSNQSGQENYRLQLSVRQFSHRMRAAAIVAGVFFVLIAYVVRLLLLQSVVQISPFVTLAGYLVAWFYIASMPLLFGFRTRLVGYVVKEHWMWFAVWWALPLDYYVVKFQFLHWPWIPVTFIALLAFGWLFRSRRNELYLTELQHQIPFWERLLPLGVLDLLTLNYWSVRREG